MLATTDRKNTDEALLRVASNRPDKPEDGIAHCRTLITPITRQ
jgi:hypothetical protein